jgi:hypothetical protein
MFFEIRSYIYKSFTNIKLERLRENTKCKIQKKQIKINKIIKKIIITLLNIE